jgi:hypothetical protein
MTRRLTIFRDTFATLQPSSVHRRPENICRLRHIKNRPVTKLYKAKVFKRALYINRKTSGKRPKRSYMSDKFLDKKR